MPQEPTQEQIDREKIDTPSGTNSKPKKSSTEIGEGPYPAG